MTSNQRVVLKSHSPNSPYWQKPGDIVQDLRGLVSNFATGAAKANIMVQDKETAMNVLESNRGIF